MRLPLSDISTLAPGRLSVRVGVLAAIVLVAFGVLVFRLWALQVLSTSTYVALASDNSEKTVIQPAPRGSILDDSGHPLVRNRAAQELQLDPRIVGDSAVRHRLLVRMARLLDEPARPFWERVEAKLRAEPVSPVTIARNIDQNLANEVEENGGRYRGITVVQSAVRYYPHNELASHVFGLATRITREQLASPDFRQFRPDAVIGQGGVEGRYDNFLRGQDGIERVAVDAQGQPTGGLRGVRATVPGDDIQLTIDLRTQGQLERALKIGIAKGSALGSTSGGMVAISPTTGEIKAIASAPTFNPNFFSLADVPRIARQLKAYTADANKPFFDRTVLGQFAPASTFKPFTAVAAVREGLLDPLSKLPCTGSYLIKSDAGPEFNRTLKNWDTKVDTTMNLETALTRSCDTYFYSLGRQIFDLPGKFGAPLQATASQFGFGRTTGLDIGGEAAGILPDQKYKCTIYPKRFCRNGVARGNAIFNAADEVTLAIGQNELKATPIQLAVAYSALVNGGIIVTPHVGKAVVTPTGTRPLRYANRGRIKLGRGLKTAIADGLFGVTHDPAGTASKVFGSFAIDVAGKTGTAQRGGDRKDNALFVSWAPADKPEILVVSVIESGGHGGVSAAIAAAEFYSKYFGVPMPDVSNVEDSST